MKFSGLKLPRLLHNSLKLSIDEVESSPAKVVADSVIEDDDEIEEDDEGIDSEEFEAEFDSLDDIDDEIEEGEDF